MSEDIKAQIEEICDILQKKDNFIILSHTRPDGDTLGSAFALREALTLLGKHAEVANDDIIENKFFYLTGGNNSLNPSFKPGCVLAVDIASENLIGDELRQRYTGKVDVCIDHHRTHDAFAPVRLVAPEYAATAEIIYEIVIALGVEFNQNIARAIYTGVLTDTGCFMYSNTTAHTHLVAMEAIKTGIDFVALNNAFYMNKTLGQINLEKHIYNSIEFYFDGKLSLASVTLKDIEEAKAENADIDGLSALMRGIEGVEASVLIKETKDGSFKVSMRSKGGVDVSEICAVFGGGGHKGAAGCSFGGKSLEEVKKILLDELESRFKLATGANERN
ncbi:MAG: bifunctional oligoribonuclease/PAP phosphatase NrnA [Bacillota bacterium]|nr:bifunctional oligoribonuclease/PAP phosphatase NrnA [Bacillota bacterium]